MLDLVIIKAFIEHYVTLPPKCNMVFKTLESVGKPEVDALEFKI